MDTITNLRKYRILESPINVYNTEGKGVAVFDLVSSIVGFYLVDLLLFSGQLFRTYGYKYYASIIPLGVIVHLSLYQQTFLNKQLFSSELNIHKIIVAIVMVYLLL